MRRVLLVVVVLALAACTATPAPGPSPALTPTPPPGERPVLTVEVAGGAWVVRGTGFEGGDQYLVQCTGDTTAGANVLDQCDMSTSEQVVADERGRISATRPARAFVHVGAVSEVDCTGEPCVLAVADLTDRVLAAATASLPRDAQAPDAPTLTLSGEVFRADKGRVTVTGAGYAPATEVRIVQCATSGAGVEANSCLYDDGVRLVADSTGTVTDDLVVRREIQLVDGGVVDCSEAGACVIANAWTDGGRMALADLLWE